MVKGIMNAVYVAIGLAFARKIYEKACSDPYEGLKRAAKEYRNQQLNILVGEPNIGKRIVHKSIADTLVEASRCVSIGKSHHIVPVVPMFSSTPKMEDIWKPVPSWTEIRKG